MATLTKQSLIYVENLTPPSVIVLTANVGCNQCQERVSQLISKMAGLQEYMVDVHNRQVTMKGDLGIHWKVKEDDLNSKMKREFHPLKFLFKSLRATCFRNHLAD